MSTPTQNQQEQNCKQTSSIYWIERIPSLRYIINQETLQATGKGKNCSKILLKDTLDPITFVFDQGPKKQNKTTWFNVYYCLVVWLCF